MVKERRISWINTLTNLRKIEETYGRVYENNERRRTRK
jgi:hypothetical protein